MEKNRFKHLLESKSGDVKPLLSESEEDKEFVVTDNTTVDELESHLDEKIEGRYSYGSESTLEDIVNYLVYNSLIDTGKSEEEAESMADDFVGTPYSTFTTFIHQERHRNGLPSFKFFPRKFDNVNNPTGPFSWNKHSFDYFSWERDWEECYLNV